MKENHSYHRVLPEAIISENLMTKIGLATDKEGEYTVLDGVMLLHKKEMTTLEKIQLAAKLMDFVYDELLGEIEELCGECDACECSAAECPFIEEALDDGIEISECLRKSAGIPEDAPLCADTKGDGSIIIRSAKDVPCIQSIPREIRDYWGNSICWAALDALIKAEADRNGG